VSSGRAHARATMLLVIPAGLLAASVLDGDAVSNVIAGAVGCLTGRIIEPDLDVDGITQSEWKMIKRFWIFGMLWVTLWYPYAWAIPHRSPFSHFPLLGTAGRVFYLMVVVTAVSAVLRAPVPILDIVAHPLFYPWFVGLALADTAHFLMDVVPSRLGALGRFRILSQEISR